jgi:DNA (cytosine-5)-methyltransferase 1
MYKTKALFSFIDLFCGIGGLRLAVENNGGTCVFSSEIDKHCLQMYQENFHETPAGDITKINPLDIPNHDMLVAGFPCQPFSISGKQKGFEDTRGTLFFHIMKIVQAKKPSVVFLENVKHLKDHDNHKTLKTIISSLENEGYIVNWQILNAKDFGLAQNRERIVIVASNKQKFNFNLINKLKKEYIIRDILDKKGTFEYLEPEHYTILDKSLWRKQKSGLIFCGYRNKNIRANGTRKNTEHLSRVHKQPNRIYHVDGTHPTLPSQESAGRFWIYDGKDVRKITMNECFRLMGFPDTFKKVSKKAELYKQIGNSVPINMMEEVTRAIKQQYFEEKVYNKQISADNFRQLEM